MSHQRIQYIGQIKGFAIFLVVNLFKMDVPEKIGNLLSLLGQKSLHIYILQVFFVIQLPIIGEFIIEQNGMTCVVLQSIYSFVLTINSSLIIQ